MPSSSSLLGVGCCLKGSDLEGLEWFCLKGAYSGLSEEWGSGIMGFNEGEGGVSK